MPKKKKSQKVDYEVYEYGPIKLERIASGYTSCSRSYKFAIKNVGQIFVIDPSLTFKEIVADLKKERSREEIAARFHLTVAQMIRKACLKIRDDNKVNTVVLTGGVFQNKILLRSSLDLLKKEGFRILTHKMLSCSDASISLGQAAIAWHSS